MATISHGGRFWDVYVEFADEAPDDYSARGALCFLPADANEGEQACRTAEILIENSREEALARARTFEEHQLAGLLRSCLPD
jgi:hypothetical protein